MSRSGLATRSNMCSNIVMRWSGQQVLDDGVGAELALPGSARAAAHRTRAGVRRHDVPRGRGEVGAEPRARATRRCPSAGPSTRTGAARTPASTASTGPPGCCWPTAAPGRSPTCGSATPCWAPRWTPGSRRYVRHARCSRTGRRASPPTGSRLAGRHRARRQRRAPLPDRPRMAARGAGVVPGRAPAAGCAGATSCSARVRCPLPGPHGRRTAQGYLHGLVRADTAGRPQVHDGRIDHAFPSDRLELEALGRAHHLLATASSGAAAPAPRSLPARASSERRGHVGAPARRSRRRRSRARRAGPRRAARRRRIAADRADGRVRSRPARSRGARATRTTTGAPGSSAGVADARRRHHRGGLRLAIPDDELLGSAAGRCTGSGSRSSSRAGARVGAGGRCAAPPGSGTCGWRAASASSCGSPRSPTRR